jgi:hypothetical protein
MGTPKTSEIANTYQPSPPPTTVEQSAGESKQASRFKAMQVERRNSFLTRMVRAAADTCNWKDYSHHHKPWKLPAGSQEYIFLCLYIYMCV